MRHLWIFLVVFSIALPQMNAQDCALNEQNGRTEILIKNPAKKEKKNKGEKQSKKKETRNPKTATWLALIPGAGQAYNGKYWKMPIVYVGFGVTGYLGITNGNDYRLYRDAYDYKTGVREDVSDKAKSEAALYTTDQLTTQRDYYRRNMELSWIIMAAWYIVQVIDACVDAHFLYYEIDDNLTLEIEPQVKPAYSDYAYGYGSTAGFSIKLNF